MPLDPELIRWLEHDPLARLCADIAAQWHASRGERLQVGRISDELLEDDSLVEAVRQLVQVSASRRRDDLAAILGGAHDWYQAQRARPISYPHFPPTDGELRFVFLCLDKGKEEALAFPLVIQILGFLRRCAADELVHMRQREEASEALRALLTSFVPQPAEPTLLEVSPQAFVKRRALLEAYEAEYRTLKKLLARGRRNSADRLLALEATYPQIPRAEFHAWYAKDCAKIAHGLIAPAFDTTAETVRKVLQYARIERKMMRPLKSDESSADSQ